MLRGRERRRRRSATRALRHAREAIPSQSASVDGIQSGHIRSERFCRSANRWYAALKIRLTATENVRARCPAKRQWRPRRLNGSSAARPARRHANRGQLKREYRYMAWRGRRRRYGVAGDNEYGRWRTANARARCALRRRCALAAATRRSGLSRQVANSTVTAKEYGTQAVSCRAGRPRAGHDARG